MPFPDLNEDVFAHLISFVSSPVDLLTLCLTNKQLFALSHPELIYRFVRCRLGNDDIWQHFVANPLYASRVRKLEIQRENPGPSHRPLDETQRLPISGSNVAAASTKQEIIARLPPRRESVERSERLLIQAIRLMVNLESFTWDRWVPVINFGDKVYDVRPFEKSGDTETIEEDVWTVLRDYTKLRKVHIVDLGTFEAQFTNVKPIYWGSMFTLSNLTHVHLKIYYFPPEGEGDEHVNPGEDDEGEDDEGEDDWLPARGDITPLKEMLQRCPNLQSLSLEFLDRPFANRLPYTDISPILSAVNWPQLSVLSLRDIIIDDEVMADFLNKHQNIQTLTAFLSFHDEGLPRAPFSLGTSLKTCLQRGALPKLEILDLVPELVRHILGAVSKPSAIRNLRDVEPCDWAAAVYEDAFVPGLDDTWGLVEPTDEDAGNEGPKNRARLDGMPNLRILAAVNVESFAQLELLAKVTPHLEVLSLSERNSINMCHVPAPHMEWLPILSQWRCLTTLSGVYLWPRGYAMSSNTIATTAKEIAMACPKLQKLPWVDGATAMLVRERGGKVRVRKEIIL